MTKTPPKRPPKAKPKSGSTKKFEPKLCLMFSKQQAKDLAAQINKLRKENPELFEGPLGELIDLMR